MAPALLSIVGQVKRELENNLSRLLSLNPSRREAIAQHLESLANLPASPSHTQGTGDAAGGLRRWIEGPRSPAQAQALQCFFEEVAMVALGQAILLKAWSDRGLRALKEEDLGRLNWALSSALKPHVPLDREGWQITRPNLYSWYNPSPSIQAEAWKAFESWRISDEGPSLLAALLRLARRKLATPIELGGYDERFFSSVWEKLPELGFDPNGDNGPMRRKRTVFSPTLRDGSMVRTGPVSINWIGLESHPFKLIAAELTQLWWGPSAPPIWSLGTGLEVHARDQLQLQLGSPKPSLFSRIAEMEACDLAFVLEERITRCSSRTSEAARLREQLESLPYFKKLKNPTTSLGVLQACVAITKLRPGGLMWWAREEALSPTDGDDALRFLLDHSKLVCEWKLSDLGHCLPSTGPLFPGYLYLFARETELKERLAHRPIRITVQGQVRSHIEVPLLLGDALQGLCAVRESQKPSVRGNWVVHGQSSPTPQKEWTERWPEAAATETLGRLDRLRNQSHPLASFTTVRATPHGDPARDGTWSVHPSLRGLWFQASPGPDGKRRLQTHPLPKPEIGARGNGFLVLVPDEAWLPPLAAYLGSAAVSDWLDHHCERKGDQWALGEQAVKFIPVPKTLLRELGAQPDEPGSQGVSFAVPLPGEWERLAAEIPYQPKVVRSRIAQVPAGEDGARVRAALFVRAARALEGLKTGQGRLLSLVRDDGTVRWTELLQVLPRSECVSPSLHPMVRLSGSLPPHLPIARITKSKTPLPGILLATESGLNLHVGSENARIVEMLWEQTQGLHHPTWNELNQYLKLPRHLEIAETTAQDVLRSHGEQSARLVDLRELLVACSDF